MAVFVGCIPVVSIPDNTNTLDELLPWHEFAVIVPPADVPRLPQILRTITPAEEARMRAKLGCVWGRLWFSSVYGSCFGEDPANDAFDGVLRVLAARLQTAHGDERGRGAREGVMGAVAETRAKDPAMEACLAKMSMGRGPR